MEAEELDSFMNNCGERKNRYRIMDEEERLEIDDENW